MKEGEIVSQKERMSVYKICSPFFNDENRIEEFGLRNPYDLTVLNLKHEVIFEGYRVLKKPEDLNNCFDLYLKENGYIPDKADITIGSEFNGKWLPNWLRYSNPTKTDLWVNYAGDVSPDDGAWLDIMITNVPEQIVPRNTIMSDAFARAGYANQCGNEFV